MAGEDVVARGLIELSVSVDEQQLAAQAKRTADQFSSDLARHLDTKSGKAANALSGAFGGIIPKDFTVRAGAASKAVAGIGTTATATASRIAGAARSSTALSAGMKILSFASSAAGLQMGAVALAGAAAAFIFTKLKGETISLEEKIKLLGDTSTTAADKLRKVFDLSDLDLAQVNKDVAGITREAEKLANLPTLAGAAESIALLNDLGKAQEKNAFGADIVSAAEANEAKIRTVLTAAVKEGLIAQSREWVQANLTGDARERASKLIDEELTQRAKQSVLGIENNRIDQEAIDRIQGKNTALELFNKNTELQLDLTEKLAGAEKNYSQALRSVSRAHEGVADAQKAGERAARDAAAAVENATENLADAQQRLNELLAEGGEEELTTTRERLTDATEALADAEERRAEAAAALAELLAPATEEELSEGLDAVTLAEIRLARAIRERDKAAEDSNKKQRQSIDLSGLTLDQVRAKLAQVRLTLSLQRTEGKGTEDLTKLQEDHVIAEIDVRDATQGVTDAKETLRALELKGLSETPKITKARSDLARADEDVAQATRDSGTARTALVLIESGVSAFAATLVTARNSVRDAEDQVAAANLRVADAAEESARRVRDANDTLIESEDKVTDAVKRRTDAQDELNKARLAAGPLDVAAAAFQNMSAVPFIERMGPNNWPQGLSSGSGNIGGTGAWSFAEGLGANATSSADKVIDAITVALSENEMFIRLLREAILRETSGRAAGGVIQGVSGPAGRLFRLGENSRDEMVLPLQSGTDTVWRHLSENLPKYPSLQQGILKAAAPLLPTRTAITLPSHSSGAQSRQDENRQQQMMEDAFYAALTRAGGKDGGDFNITVQVAADAKIPDALAAKRLARQVQAEIARKIS